AFSAQETGLGNGKAGFCRGLRLHVSARRGGEAEGLNDRCGDDRGDDERNEQHADDGDHRRTPFFSGFVESLLQCQKHDALSHAPARTTLELRMSTGSESSVVAWK